MYMSSSDLIQIKRYRALLGRNRSCSTGSTGPTGPIGLTGFLFQEFTAFCFQDSV